MLTKLPYPEFASEAEEAAWLFEHDDELDEYFEPMNVSVGEMLLRDHDLTQPEGIYKIPISIHDLARARAIANTKDQSVEEYLGQIVHEALQLKCAA